MMGRFETGEMIGRDGSTVFEDANAFGQEWQVLDTEPKLFVELLKKYPPASTRERLMLVTLA